jgi:hypothetical protein
VSVPQTTEGIGLAGLTIGVMALFGGITLAVVFLFHSILQGFYAFSQWSGIPFLVLLAWPIWMGIPAVLLWRLLKRISHS